MAAPADIPVRPRTLVISNIAWDFVWQRHQTVASLFARDSDVLFFEIPGSRRPGLRDLPRLARRLKQQVGGASGPGATPPPRGLRIARPFVLPATNAAACAMNARLLRAWLRGEPQWSAGVARIIAYSQTRTSLQLIDAVPHRQLVYECTDDWLSVRGIPSFLAEDERRLLARADLTLVPSRRLEELKRPLARRLERVPHGVMLERFQVPLRRRGAGEPPTLLYYGHLLRQHLDFELLAALASGRPDWRLKLVGPVKTPFRFPDNVFLAGQQPHEKLREFIAGADVLLLPYVLNEYTRSVMPAKTFECLASGRPIVATPLPELTAGFASDLRFASDAPGFVREIALALEEPADAAARRMQTASQNTWDRRYEQIKALLGERVFGP